MRQQNAVASIHFTDLAATVQYQNIPVLCTVRERSSEQPSAISIQGGGGLARQKAHRLFPSTLEHYLNGVVSVTLLFVSCGL